MCNALNNNLYYYPSCMQYYRSVSDHYPVYVEVNFGTSGGTDPQGKGYNRGH